jgi:hypothetical protein
METGLNRQRLRRVWVEVWGRSQPEPERIHKPGWFYRLVILGFVSGLCKRTCSGA